MFISSQPEDMKKDTMTAEEVAMGFIRVANETMCRPIRALTQVKTEELPIFSCSETTSVIKCHIC